MRGQLFAVLIAASALMAPATVATAQRAPARTAAQDWTRTAVRTPEGGFRMGNPAAPVKVVEFLSLTCPHCAAFAHEGTPQLMNYVRRGQVSLEYRNINLNGLDIAAAMVSRCAAPRAYFDMTHTLLGTQANWAGRTSTLTPAQREEIGRLPPLQIAQRLVGVLGLDAIGARYGVTPRMRQACVTQAAMDQLDGIQRSASALGVEGTPTFVINGRIVPTNTWSGLEPLLRVR